MTKNKESGSKESRSKSGAGTYGIAPLGYVELSGIREALQKATDEISRLEGENKKLKERLGSLGAGGKSPESKKAWDYSHLGETEQLVIRAYLKGEFRESGVPDTCRRLSRIHGRKAGTYRKVFARLRDYGVLTRIESGES